MCNLILRDEQKKNAEVLAGLEAAEQLENIEDHKMVGYEEIVDFDIKEKLINDILINK